MTEKLTYHPDVETDIQSAVDHYSAISSALAYRFRDQLVEQLIQIAARPESFGEVQAPLRFARVRRFPHIVIFRLIRDGVQVLGVFHGAEDSAKWTRRIEAPSS